jgi:hypothetical protein
MAYRHGRCESCNKPTSTTNLDTTLTLLCLGCVPGRVTPEREDTTLSQKRGMNKTGRDDEEEWGGIPTPLSDDSDDEYWLDEISSAESESEQHEADTDHSVSKLRDPDGDTDDASSNLTSQTDRNPIPKTKDGKTRISMINLEDVAFLIGPRRDGDIQRKDGTILTFKQTTATLNPLQSTREPSLEPIASDSSSQPTFSEHLSWTGHLMRFQRFTLKMGYKSKSRLRAKLMKIIRKTNPTQAHIKWTLPQSRHIDVRP